MIRKLQIKFIIINMVIVTAMLCVIFGLVYNFTRHNLESESISMMRSIAAGTFPSDVRSCPATCCSTVSSIFSLSNLSSAISHLPRSLVYAPDCEKVVVKSSMFFVTNGQMPSIHSGMITKICRKYKKIIYLSRKTQKTLCISQTRVYNDGTMPF